MAAGLGFKTFSTGDVLSATDVNGYLMQGILVFASAAARDAAITAPAEGQFAYLKDTNVTTYYTGSAWANVDTTGMTNPMTTTGDTIYSSSGSTPARLGIGTAGQVLQVNSGATAPEWTTPAGGGAAFYPPKRTGFFLSTPCSTYGTVTPTNQRTYFLPIFLPTGTLNRISCATTGTFSGTATVRLGIYNADANNLPSTVLLDAGTVNCTSSTTVYNITISQAITEGFYWLAFNSQTNASTNHFEGPTGSIASVNTLNMRFSDTTGQSCVGVVQSGVSGAFGTFSYSDVTADAPIIFVRQA
jgi:hypothetical protein